MPTTSNFGWTTPADTDLVKDGAAAIRTLGNGIDTSFLDLKGGTSGQVLAKNSNTDLDFTWVAQDDSNAIQNAIVDAKGDIIAATAADTPARLPVGTNDQRLVAASGEATGLKYVSDTQNTVVDAKGDLIVGTAADTVARLAVGTNGYTLVADSAETTGLKWAAPAASGFVGCKAYLSGNQSIANNTATALTYGSESFDTDAFHSTSTNTSRFTIPSGKGGKYSFDAQVQFNQVVGAEAGLRSAAFFKNGTQVTAGVLMNTSTDESTAFTLSYIADLVATDYVELFVFQTQGGSVNCSGGEVNNYCALTFLGA